MTNNKLDHFIWKNIKFNININKMQLLNLFSRVLKLKRFGFKTSMTFAHTGVKASQALKTQNLPHPLSLSLSL